MRRLHLPASLLALALIVPAGAASAVNTGTADFTHYVSVGDSLTAGFTSGSLIDTSQRVDYPAIIELQATGSNSGFQQPLVSPPGIPPILQLRGLFPTVIAPSAGLGQPENLNLPRPYDNLAVPGENVHTMINTVTDHGGLHDLILRGIGTQLLQAAGSHPTFLTVWIGNNDALAAATSGIVIDGVTLTTLDSFQADYTTIIHTLASTGAKMAIANIPDVTTIPFVSTIPPVLVNPRTNLPVLDPSGHMVPLIGPDGPLQPGDHVLLTAAADLAQGKGVPVVFGGTGQPLTDSDVLSAAETAAIRARVQQFNAVIQAQATAVGAAYVDASALLTQLATQGIEVGGLNFSSAFLTGGVFGYDGVHPTAFGYSYIANAFIQAINAQFGAEIPPANLATAIFGTSAESLEKKTAAPGYAILTKEAVHELFKAMNWPEPGTLTTPVHRRRHHAS